MSRAVPAPLTPSLAVTGRTLGVDESLEKARAGRGLNLATTLTGFRELAAEEMMVNRDQSALVSTYAYIVDPTRDTGVTDLPVVVEAQDIMFIDDGQFVVVTVAADASQWAEQQRDFQLILDSLRLRPMPESTADTQPRPAPAPTPAVVNRAASAAAAASKARGRTAVRGAKEETDEYLATCLPAPAATTAKRPSNTGGKKPGSGRVRLALCAVTALYILGGALGAHPPLPCGNAKISSAP